VWSDVTKLIGGEPFWARIETAIREHSIKFLFVLSHASNDPSRGTIDELHLARSVARKEALKDFVIPLRTDDLPFSERNVAIQQLNVVNFEQSWAEGLARVLKKFEEDGVPRDTSRFNPSAVSSWWRAHCDGRDIVRPEPEQYLSNWFHILGLPEEIRVHSLASSRSPLRRGDITLPFPVFPIRREVVSFACAEDIGLTDAHTLCVPTLPSTKADNPDLPISARECRNALMYILRTGWLSAVRSVKMHTYRMANERVCAYFTQDMLEGKLLSFDTPEGLSGRRALVGQSKGRTWHFGLSVDVRMEPFLCYLVRPHVLFSDDGITIWASTSRLHRARRATCKNWWNQHWRDRVLASMYWIAHRQGESAVSLPLSSSATLRVPITPVTFESPVSYDDATVRDDPFADEAHADAEHNTDEGEVPSCQS